MNYYEHHLGDYMRDTAHLSILEDGAYRRLIDAYYIREEPLPGDLKKCYKLARAQSKAERDAVDSVLEEFFDLEADGYHHKRCDEEIAKYQAKQEGKQEKKENEAERQRRYRERRKQLFAELNKLGVTPSFDLNNSELETVLLETQSRNGHGDVTESVTRDVTHHITATQTPVTSNQTPDLKPSLLDTRSQVSSEEDARAQPGIICKAIKDIGIVDVSPSHPLLLKLINAGATQEEFEDAARTCKAKGKKFAYLLAMVEGMRADAANAVVTQGKTAKPNDQTWRFDDVQIMAKARELEVHTTGKTKFEILAAIDKKEGRK